MGRRRGRARVVKTRGVPSGGAGQIDMSALNQLTAGMSDEQRKMIMAQAMQAARNPNAYKIAQKVANKGGKKGKNGRKKMRAQDAMNIKDELMNNPDMMRGFGFDPSNMPADMPNLPQPPPGGLPLGFPSVPAEVRAAFEGDTHKCDQCKQQGNCLHDGETDAWLCSPTCQQIMRSKLGIKDGEHHCHNPSCDEDGINRCASCKRSFYCSGECQKAHWKSHKKLCRMVKKAEKERAEALAAQEESDRAERMQRQQEEELFAEEVDAGDDAALDAFLADVDEDDDDGGWLVQPTAQQEELLAAVDAVAEEGQGLELRKMGEDDEEVDMDAMLSTIDVQDE